MNCPNCGKVIVVKLLKDTGAVSRPAGVKMTGVSGEVEALLNSIDDVMLTGDFEPNFVRDQRERLEKYGERLYMSDAQMKTLRKIAASCGVD